MHNVHLGWTGPLRRLHCGEAYKRGRVTLLLNTAPTRVSATPPNDVGRHHHMPPPSTCQQKSVSPDNRHHTTHEATTAGHHVRTCNTCWYKRRWHRSARPPSLWAARPVAAGWPWHICTKTSQFLPLHLLCPPQAMDSVGTGFLARRGQLGPAEKATSRHPTTRTRLVPLRPGTSNEGQLRGQGHRPRHWSPPPSGKDTGCTC